MKMILIALFTAVFSIATVSIERSVAQAESYAMTHAAAQTAVQAGDARKSFEQLKLLAGTWEARVTTVPPMADMEKGIPGEVSLRVTSRGNAIVHEMKQAGAPDDPTKYDHPVTMIYLDSDRLLLTHYCDAGNRPRMVGKVSADGKTVDFDFLDVAGSTEYGHMHHAKFTVIDANHHTEDWTYMMPGDKPMWAHMELTRTK